MSDKFLSPVLQQDILRALSIFHPDPFTEKQYFNCFGDVDEFIMLANIDVLICKGLIRQDAIRRCEDEPFLCLGRLKLNNKGYELAIHEEHRERPEVLMQQAR